MPGAVILLDRVVWNENYFLNRELSILVFLKFSYEFGIGKEKERKRMFAKKQYLFFCLVNVFLAE